MRPRLSRHAAVEAGRRQIPLSLLESVLDAPEQVIVLSATLAVYQSRTTDGAGRGCLIRAIISTEMTPGVVVTVYRTSKIQKYWRPQ
jgi:hypothetical protein